MSSPAADDIVGLGLLKRPAVAWPTLGLYTLVLTLYAYTLTSNTLSYAVALPLLTYAAFVSFTVVHDAVHGAVTQHKRANYLIGWSAAWALGPTAVYAGFREEHLAHHKHTNVEGKDPDLFTSLGAHHGTWWALTMPLRWNVLEAKYYISYLPILHTRPSWETLDVVVTLALRAALLWTGLTYSWFSWSDLFYFWVLPAQIAKCILAATFDWIPHHPSLDTSRYGNTSIREGGLLCRALLLYQDLHLIHHLYPLVPFYRYAAIWSAKEDFLRAQGVVPKSLFEL